MEGDLKGAVSVMSEKSFPDIKKMCDYLNQNHSDFNDLKTGLSFISRQKIQAKSFFRFVEHLFTQISKFDQNLEYYYMIWKLVNFGDFSKSFSFYLETFPVNINLSEMDSHRHYFQIIESACKISEMDKKIMGEHGFFVKNPNIGLWLNNIMEFSLKYQKDDSVVTCCLRLFLESIKTECSSFVTSKHLESLLEFGLLDFKTTRENIYLSLEIFLQSYRSKSYSLESNLRNLALKLINKATEHSDPVCMEKIFIIMILDNCYKYSWSEENKSSIAKDYLFYLSPDLFKKLIAFYSQSERYSSILNSLAFHAIEEEFTNIQGFTIADKITEIAIFKIDHDISTNSIDFTGELLFFLQAVTTKIISMKSMSFSSEDSSVKMNFNSLKELLHKNENRFLTLWPQKFDSVNLEHAYLAEGFSRLFNVLTKFYSSYPSPYS